MKIKATVQMIVNPDDYVNVQTGKLEVPITDQDADCIHTLLSEVYSNIISVQVEEIP